MRRVQRTNLVDAAMWRVACAFFLFIFASCSSDGGTGTIEVAGLRFVTQPATSGAGVPMTVSVELLSSAGNRITSATDQVTLSAAGATLGGTTTVAAVAGVATFTNVTVNSVGSNYQLTASVGDLNATSTTFTVTAGPADATHSVMTVPANVVSGANTNLTFTFKDQFNNPLTSQAVSFSTNLAGATFTPSTGTTDATGAFTTVFRPSSAGTASITVNVGGTSITFPTNITVGAGASALRFVTSPANVTAGQQFSVAVELIDNTGQRVTSATSPVTLSLSAGTLVGTATVNATAGLATFTGLAINGVATGTVMTATSGALSVQSAGFNITAGAAAAAQSTLQLSTALTTGAASALTFTIKDAFSNVVANAAVTLTTSLAAVISPTSGTTNASGVFTSSITPSAIGTGTITATVGGVPLNFTASVLGPCNVGALTLDTPLSVTLATTSGCLLNNHPASSNRFTVPAGNASVVALSATGVSAGFFPELMITTDPPGTTGGLFFGQGSGTPTNSRGPVEWLLPAGTYRALVSSSNGGGGDFTMTAANLGVGGTGCVPNRQQQSGAGRMLLGVNATYIGQALANTDCVDNQSAGGPYYLDVFTVFDSRPCDVTISAAFPIYFDLEAETTLAGPIDGPTFGTLHLNACRTSTSPIFIVVSSSAGSVSGAYTMTIAFVGSAANNPEIRTFTVGGDRNEFSMFDVMRSFVPHRRK